MKRPWVKAGWPAIQRDWINRKAKTTRSMQSGLREIPAGMTITINHVTHGDHITIKSDACAHCGVSVIMTRVSWRDLELLPAA